MVTVARADDEHDRRLAEAAGWRVLLSEADLETSAGFEAWLGADAQNAAVWAEMQALWDLFGEHAAAPEVMTARREALNRAGRVQRQRLRPHRRRPLRALMSAACAAVLVAGLGAATAWYLTKPVVYRTELGERRTVTLADGSLVTLDSGTVLKVRLLRDTRQLELDQGQARFDVSHDRARPFLVHARDQTVVAIGTSFNVDLIGSRVLVTLIEGRVSVLQDPPAALFGAHSRARRRVLATLTGGEELVTSATPGKGVSGIVQVGRVNSNEATAWQNGQLIFENEQLSSVAERVSRYAAHPVVAEGAAGQLRISGVFNAGDVATFVDTIQRGFPVEAEERDDGGVVLKPKS